MNRLNYLAIPIAVLLTACQSVGGSGDQQSADALRSADTITSEAMSDGFNMESAAEKLGISVDELKSALGDKMDIPAAAEKLGISESTLQSALGSL